VRNSTVSLVSCCYYGVSHCRHRGLSWLETYNMEPPEIHARATIAAAMILSRAVEVPTIPTSGDGSQDTAAMRLGDLTDYVYQTITSSKTR